jgi:hypothetical protein
MPKNESIDFPSPHRRRPFGITLMTGLIMLIALTGFVRMSQTIVHWGYLSGLEIISPAYLLTSGLFWGIFGLVTGLLLWLRWSQSGMLALAFLAGFSVYYWIDRIFISMSAGRLRSWAFILIVNVIGLIWAAWVVRVAKVRQYFTETAKDDAQSASGAGTGGLNG